MSNMSAPDDDVAQLLRVAGPRREPPAAVRARALASALEVFEALPEPPAATPELASAAIKRRWALPRLRHAIAAAVVLVASGALLWQSLPQPARSAAAYVNYSNGDWLIDNGLAAPNVLVPQGARVQTTGSATLELQLRDGTLLRAHHDSLFVLGAGNGIELLRGRIYIATRGGADSVRIRTAFATVHDIGTRFEVQVDGTAVTVQVREGQVQLRGDHIRLASGAALTASATDGVGESLRVDATGRIERGNLPTTGRHWRWLAEARPDYALDRGSLHDFLVWSASESGLQLRYHSEAVRRAAVDTRTRGNIDGMSPEEAIINVLATTRLRRADAPAYELLVDFAEQD